ncbi:MAG: tRNA(Ile)-lysidine synthase [Thermocaproicibacter melissae]|uniref:tRNA lysidine(34) synthetase TilS n=1 Tax=Thermocaproicibacter melissae TaxID=2966552 RepID=UPI003A102B42
MKDDVAAIEQKISETISRWNMFPHGCHVIAGLSGGADSVAMLHYLCSHSAELGIQVTAAHVNHGLRGAEADRDERFSVEFCQSLGIACRVFHTDVAAEAKQKSQGIEECGREVRYSFFRSLCSQNGRIATAHTLTDNAETVLLNLTKGAGTKGLCGIPPVRDNIVRPLLGITRQQVEQYCAHYGLNFVTDSTNLSDEYVRNNLRHHVVPALREINPAFELAIGRMTEILRCDEAFFEEQVKKSLLNAAAAGGEYQLDVLRQMPRALLTRVISAAAEKAGSSRIGYDHIAAVERIIYNGGAVEIAGGIRCETIGNTLYIGKREQEISNWSVPFVPEGTKLPDGRILMVCPVDISKLRNASKIHNLLFNNFINYDTIINTGGIVRNKRPGDAYRPAGRGVTKTLKKLFNEAKIPVSERSRLALLECGGKIVWVEGFGVSQEACVSEKSKTAAEIIIKECS